MAHLSPVGIKSLEDLEPGLLQSLLDLFPRRQGREAVPDLDPLLDPDVFTVGGVVAVLWEDDPLVTCEEPPGLEDGGDLGEGLGLVGGVAGSLDLVGCVEGGGGEFLVEVLEVALVMGVAWRTRGGGSGKREYVRKGA